MGTRCNIILPGVILYRHWDGYPSSILPDIAGWLDSSAPLAGEQYSDGRPAYEQNAALAGDAEYRYIVNIARRTVSVWERKPGEGWRRCNPAIKIRATAERARQLSAGPSARLAADMAADLDSALAVIDAFESRTGYRLKRPAPRLRLVKPAPVPAPIASKDRRWYGAKYDASLTTKEIAKRIKTDVISAQKAGAVPGGKVSVRSTGYKSINVTFTPADPAALVNPDWVQERARLIRDGSRWQDVRGVSVIAGALRETLDGIVSAYNHDGSDLHSDYFDVRFYSDIKIEGVYEVAETAAAARAL